MGGQYNDDLRRRQQNDDVGLFRFSGSTLTGRRRWVPFRVPMAVLVVGIVLSFVGPLPGLGLFLVFGAIGGLLVTAMVAFLGTG